MFKKSKIKQGKIKADFDVPKIDFAVPDIDLSFDHRISKKRKIRTAKKQK